MKAALLASKDLRATERLVLVAVAAHANREGDAWPSVATIAEYAGVSVRTVQRALAKLVHLGRLAVRQVATIATRVYRLITRHPTTAGGDNQQPGVTPTRPRGDTHDLSPEAEDHTKTTGRTAARNWRRILPTNRPAAQPHGTPQRGAALPVTTKAGQCPQHRGNPASNCGPCRSERLAPPRP
ncbi:helix-turn-helix domain-containing protein [Micromonospora coxensis]|uniref:Helix-turn-helix domain-containing protein n=1 Tax=Micromonospora coxensis TaxID=356852 RepID=A0A1C5GYE8_9ACTN|nr:Helix-turn-helix domain-containing protein [Micromonospora coxensis]